jgi:hypothetical protein
MGARCLVLVCLTVIVGTASGQYTDMECWLGTGVDQSLNKQWSWSLQWENRFTQDASWHEQGLVDAALEYRLNKHWDLNMQWRFSERQGLDGGYTARRRLALRAAGSWKAAGGKASLRLMATEDWLAQPVFAGVESLTVDRDFTPVWRTRLGYGYKLNKRWKADVSWEVFFRSGGQWSERWQLAVGADLPKRWGVEVAYLWGNVWMESDPWRSHVVRVQTTYSLRKPDRPLRPIPAARVYEDGQRMRRVSAAELECPVCAPSALCITEVRTQGQPADYIELQNISDQRCSTAGWRLTDSVEKEGWALPVECLEPQALILGYQGGRNGFSFGLSAAGESLILVGPDGEIVRELTLLPAVKGLSQGPDSAGNWTYLSPSPGTTQGGN